MPLILAILWTQFSLSIDIWLNAYYVPGADISAWNSSVNRETKTTVLAQVPPQKAWHKGWNAWSLIWEMNPGNWSREVEEPHRQEGKVNLKLYHWADYLGEQLEHRSSRDLLRSRIYVPQNCPLEKKESNSHPQLLMVISRKLNSLLHVSASPLELERKSRAKSKRFGV